MLFPGGVETRETLDTLSAMGCDYAQGFYMARPMPMPELIRWMEESPWAAGERAGDASDAYNGPRKRSA